MPVREETARRVLRGGDAARLSRDRADPAAAATRTLPQRTARLRAAEARAALLPGASQRELRGGGGARRRGCAARADVEFAAELDARPTSSRRLRGDRRARAQAVAMVAPDHPSVTAAVEELRDRGVPVFALLSDFAAGGARGLCRGRQPQGRAHRRLDDRAGGASGRARSAVFVGSHRYHGHELREIGFRSYFREHAPEFEVLETLVNLETRQITHEATLSLLQRHPGPRRHLRRRRRHGGRDRGAARGGRGRAARGRRATS